MKKIQVIALSLGLFLLLAACPADDGGGNNGNNSVNFVRLEANGDDYSVTTLLTLVFDKDIYGLTTEDVVLNGGTTGASKGAFSKVGAGSFRLGITGVVSRGSISVTVSKSGYDIANNTQNVLAYFPKSWDVTFLAYGGIPQPENQAVVHSNTVARPLSPKKAGQLFTGWYEDEAFNTRWNFSTGTVTSDVTLYARYIGQDQIEQLSAWDYFEAENLTLGWNLGNTLDAGGLNETAWGNPRITQELMNGVKASGFSLIRIPVTWRASIGPAPDYIIAEALLQRVAEVVSYAENAGLTAIINVHHDGSWLNFNQARQSQENYDRITDQFAKVWAQIADYLKDFGLFLMFSPFNEIHDGNWGSGNLEPRQFEIINNWNQVFTDTVRGSGGMNAIRYLVIPGLCQKPHLYGEDQFILPQDAVAGKLAVSFHYYEPYPFAHDGQDPYWGNADDYNVPASYFTIFKERFTGKQVPVIIGEIGPIVYKLGSQNPGNVAMAHENRLKYIGCVYGTAKSMGITPVYWDNGIANTHEYQILNRDTGLPLDEVSRECIEAMIKATQ